MSFFVTLTTIFEPTTPVIRLIAKSSEHQAKIIVAGDAKGPKLFDCSLIRQYRTQIDFISLDEQQRGPFSLGRALPVNHYSRKNIAYLHAIYHGATCIYETDDDNLPLDSWQKREEYIKIGKVIESNRNGTARWINIYRYFSKENIWPRGLPLEVLLTEPPQAKIFNKRLRSPIQQGLVNRMPDVDAIWRLTQDREIYFDFGSSVLLSPGNWCPFNTQSTWWWPVAFPLLYIPSHCSFRMCDIWKSFVAQRCLWELGYGIVFHAAEVEQSRNVHNLTDDFKQEVSGYLKNREICNILNKLSLYPGLKYVSANLRLCYQSLVDAGIFPHKELNLVNQWIDDLKKCRVVY